jgi:four helix bundle protein
MPVRSYRDLIAWQKSIDFVTEIYRCTRTFPKEETYGLMSQLRRAAVSVPSNIAEGHARLTTGEFRQFLGQSLGSLTEIESQIQIANRLGYVGREDSNRLLEHSAEIGKIVRGLLQSLPVKESRKPAPRP